MDALTQVLRTLRITTTLFSMADLAAPWGVAFPAGRGAYFHTLEGGHCWLFVEGRPPMLIAHGDTVLLAHGTPHRLTSGLDAEVRAVFDPSIWAPTGAAPLTAAAPPTPDMPHPAPPGVPMPATSSRLVCGSVEVRQIGAHPLLALLPTVVRAGQDDPGAGDLELTLRLIRREANSPGAGAQELLARLGDVLVIQLLRIWIDTPDIADEAVEHPAVDEQRDTNDTAPATWLTALRDPRLASAITAMHTRPGEAWTVDALAAEAHLSRSRFAERFSAAVGRPPLAYLTDWRLNLAAGMLLDGRSIRDTAAAVGYTSEPAFSRAFVRHHDSPPSTFAASGVPAAS